jgi:hypothetical protein
VTSADGVGCGACCRGLVSRGTGRHWATARPHYEGLPVISAGRGADEGGRKPSGRAGGLKNSGSGMRQLCPFRTRKSGPGALRKNAANERRLAGGWSAWSAGRRSVLDRKRTRRVSRKSARQFRRRFGAPPPSLYLVRERNLEAYPAPFQIIRAAERWLLGYLIFASLSVRAAKRGIQDNCAEPGKPGPLLARGRTGERRSIIRAMTLGCLDGEGAKRRAHDFRSQA